MGNADCYRLLAPAVSFRVVTIKVDNQSAIKLAINPEFHKRTKHIGVKYHYVRDVIRNGEVNIEYVESKLQLADILTKPLPKETFVLNRSRLKMDLNEIGEVLEEFH